MTARRTRRVSRAPWREASGGVTIALVALAACMQLRRVESAWRAEAPLFELSSDEPVVRNGTPAPPQADDVLVCDDFAAFDAQRWRTPGTEGAGDPARPRVQIVAEGEGARGIALLSPGEGGVHALIDVARSDAVLVTARVRSFATEHDALLRVADIGEDDRELQVGTHAIVTTPDFVEVRATVDRRRGPRRLRVSLVPGDRPLAVDRVEVTCLRAVERLWVVEAAVESRPRPRARPRVELPEMDAEMDGFYVPTGGALRWCARAPLASPRVDVETGLLGGDRGGAAVWTVVVDGVPLATRREQVAPGAWITRFSSWIVPIDSSAGRDVTVELRCSGDRDVVGFAGAPRVLGGAGREDRAGVPPNVLLISLDTLRPDRVGPRAGGPSLTPHLDRLAARGALFTNACSTSSWTLPAHASIMTGQHPLAHGTLDSDRRIDPRHSPVLAARFLERGFATAAFTAGVLVDPRFGFGTGFEAYSVRDPCGQVSDNTNPHPPRNAEIDATPARAFDWVRRHADVPFFLFLHTYHVHEYEDKAHVGQNVERCALLDRASARDPVAIAELARRYDACVTETDRDLVGALLDLLSELRLDDHTVVAVVSDHGEEFFEHGGARHALTLRNEVGSVVLVLAGPGVPHGARIEAPVILTDIAPTLARLTGLSPDPRCEGRDLFAADDGEMRPRLLHLDHLYPGVGRVSGEALWIGEWQLQRMWSEAGDATLSFERRDPETGLVIEATLTPGQRTALERRLDSEISAELRRAPPSDDSSGHELPAALREQLRALGYLGN